MPDGRRAYPDIASFAAVNRLNSIPRCDALSCRWVALGGTSAPAPTLAANLALVLDASRSAGGPERLGLLNPLLGSLSDASPPVLRDVVRGSTEMGGNRCCRAKAGWDMATGWGSIARYDRLAKQVAKLPADR